MRDFARLLFLAVVLPVLAIAALLLWQGRNAARAHYATQLSVAADMTAREVQTFLRMHRAALQMLAERGGGDARDLEQVQRAYPAFDRLEVRDAQGRVLASTGAQARSDTVKLQVAQVVGEIDTKAFPLERGWSQARGFEMVLLDARGDVVRATTGLPWKSGSPGEPVRKLRASPGGTEVATLDGVFRGDEAYAVKAPLDSGWNLVVLVPDRAVVDEMRHNYVLVLVLLFLVLLGVLGIVWLQMRDMGRSVRGLLHRIETVSVDDPPTAEQFAAVPKELTPLADAMHQFSVRSHDAYEEQKRLREELEMMTRRLLSVQEDERRTLSRELHDDIGQAITAIKLGAMALQDDDDAGNVHTREILAEIITTTDQTVAKLRNLSMLLRPPQLDTLGLETALRWQAETLFRSGKPELTIAMTPLPHRPSPEVELACFRIAQEAMTNIVRHADANRVRMSLATTREGDALRLEIEDDGRGFSPEDRSGLGLLTMRERAHLAGGTLEMSGIAGRGVRVCAVLPL